MTVTELRSKYLKHELLATLCSWEEYVFELQYADDAALPSHTGDGLQRNLDRICEAYRRAGLVVNVKKTEVLPQASQQHYYICPATIYR